MRIQQLFKTQGKGSGRQWVIQTALIALLLALMAGCGGSKSKSVTVAVVTVSPASLSLVAGQVVSLSASAADSSNTTVTTTFTFNSSNTRIATISPAGLVCAGVWDSIFVVCNGLDSLGKPISGTATISATAQGITSGPVQVSVHPPVTSVTVDPPPAGGCFSIAQTHQFVAHAFNNATEVTNQVGDFTWLSSAAGVASVDANGLATSRVPGITGIVASVGTTTSPAVFLKSCMPVLLVLHISGDPAGTATESVTMNVTDTKTIQVDMIDELGTVTPNAPVTISSNNNIVAALSGPTLTALSPGGAGLQAACVPPVCGFGINTPIYSNLFGITVNGTSPNTTTVYAASSFAAPAGTPNTLIPIDISKTPPAVGTAINLPGIPNSILFDRAGAHAFIGTNNGLVVLDATTNTVTLVTPVPVGKVLAVSPDGNVVLISNSANDPSTNTPIDPNASEQRVWLFNQGASTITTFVLPGGFAAVFDDDDFRAYVVASNGNVYVLSTVLTTLTTSIPGSTNNIDVANLASGPFTYVASSPGGLKAIATCNNVVQATSPPTNSSTIQLIGKAKSIDEIVAVDSTGVDVETVTVTQLTPPLAITPSNCEPNVSYSNNFIDFGVGAFTAHQLLVAPDGKHMAVLPAGINKVFTILNGTGLGVAQLPAGATEALSGGMTLDGATIWLGVAGTNSVDRINLLNNIDEVQLPMTFKKQDGSAAPPNLVVIKPK
jgi:hypothetical protein